MGFFGRLTGVRKTFEKKEPVYPEDTTRLDEPPPEEDPVEPEEEDPSLFTDTTIDTGSGSQQTQQQVAAL